MAVGDAASYALVLILSDRGLALLCSHSPLYLSSGARLLSLADWRRGLDRIELAGKVVAREQVCARFMFGGGARCFNLENNGQRQSKIGRELLTESWTSRNEDGAPKQLQPLLAFNLTP